VCSRTIVAVVVGFRQVVAVGGDVPVCDCTERPPIGPGDKRCCRDGAEHGPAECGFIGIVADGALEAPGDALPGSLLDGSVRRFREA